MGIGIRGFVDSIFPGLGSSAAGLVRHFFRGQGVSITAPSAASLQLQTSTLGRAIAAIFGTMRIAPNLIWFGDFMAIAHTSTEGGGGKGGGGGGVSQTAYTYQTALLLALCEGPIGTVMNVWNGKERSSLAALNLSFFTGSYAQSPPSFLTTGHPAEALSYRGIAYLASPVYDLGDSAQLPNHGFEVEGLLPYGSSGQTGKTFTANPATDTLISTAHGFAEGASIRISTTGTLPVGLVFSMPTNLYIRNPTTNTYQVALEPGGTPIELPDHTTEVRTIPGSPFQVTVFNVAGFVVDLGVAGFDRNNFSAPSIGEYNESGGTYTFNASDAGRSVSISYQFSSSGSGTQTATRYIPDAEPTAVIAELVTNLNFGLQQSSAILGSFTQAANACIANGVFVSPAYIEQEAAGSIIARLAQIANAAPFWSEDVLKLVPYWDVAASGNGASFTPNLTPIYDLTDDDYLDPDQPVKCQRSTPADAFNQRVIKFLSRSNQYNETTAEFKDQDDIEIKGLKQAPEQTVHEIADAAVAQKVADTLGRSGLFLSRNGHVMEASWRYDLLEPMDLITLSDSAMGLSLQLVRIVSIQELDEGEGGLEFTVQEVEIGAASPAIYSSQIPAGFRTDFNIAPGSVNAPVIFEGPGILAPTGFEVWIALSGPSANWGGCNVWVSTDNAEYKQVGQIIGPARHGTLSASFATGADPDTTHTCSVDLTVSRGELAGGAQADADNFSTLSLVEGELIAFETALLTSQYHYDLKDYIRRGVYNTPVSSHASSSRFVRLDQAVFRFAYDSALIGKTIFFKFPSFNTVGGGGEDISAVPAYSYTLVGPIGAPANVGTLTFIDPFLSWPANTEANLRGYIVRYQPGTSTDWATAITAHKAGFITENRFDTGDIVGGQTTLLVKSLDSSDKESAAATSILVDLRPATPSTFLVSVQPDGTREFTWTLTPAPADLDGFHIRFFLGTTSDWNAMTPLHNGVLPASPFESNQLAAGTYTFAIKSVDRAGNESANALFITTTIGDPRIAGAVEDIKEEPTWTGTKTDCAPDAATGWLLANDTATWAGLPSTWDAWTSWISAPVGTIVYVREIDIGVVTRFVPLVTTLVDGSQTIEEQHSNDGSSYSSYVAVGPELNARFVRIRVTVTGAFPKIKTMRTILSASPIVEIIEDQNSASLAGAHRIGTGDIRLPIVKTYNVIKKVDITLQSVGPGWSVELIDKDTSVGPRIKIYNGSNALADAVFDATVTGL
ncbi:MAG TPA: phage tail protein [Burkholderiales bacterium]|nr:phage tail protein [Burkholderiales bacterium]